MRDWMRTLSAVVLSLGYLACGGNPGDSAPPEAEGLVGTWRVDLRPTPDAEPCDQEFVVERRDGVSFSGRSYGSPIENARVDTDRGQVRFAFTNVDGSRALSASEELVGARLRGTTHSLGRGFLAARTAEPMGPPTD